MTKSDYKAWVNKNFTFLAISDAYSLIDYIFEKGFEDQEPKSCYGCSYSISGKPYDKSHTCNTCIRYTDKTDNYEQKDDNV